MRRSRFRQSSVVSNLLLTSLLSGTDGPAGVSAGGLWARGEEEGLSSSGASVVTTSSVSTGWIGVSDGKKERRTSVDQTEYKISPGKIGPDASTGLQAVTVAALQSNYGWKIRLGVKNH